MDSAIDSYPFKGEVVYDDEVHGNHRVGLVFSMTAPAVVSYQKYLSVRFQKMLRKTWEDQLKRP